MAICIEEAKVDGSGPQIKSPISSAKRRLSVGPVLTSYYNFVSATCFGRVLGF